MNRSPVEQDRLVRGGTAFYPREHATFEESKDCWDVIGWLLLIVASIALFVGCLAFLAGYLLHRWGLV